MSAISSRDKEAMHDARLHRFSGTSEAALQAGAMGERTICPSGSATHVSLSSSLGPSSLLSPGVVEQITPVKERPYPQQPALSPPRAILNGVLVRSALIQEWIDHRNEGNAETTPTAREATLARMARESLQNTTHPNLEALDQAVQPDLLRPIIERLQPALEAIDRNEIDLGVFYGRGIQQVSTPTMRGEEALNSMEQTTKLTQDFATALITLSEMKKTEAVMKFLRVIDLSDPSSVAGASFWSSNRGRDFAEQPLILNNGEQSVPIFIPEEGSIPAHVITPPIIISGAKTVFNDPETRAPVTHGPLTSAPTSEENESIRILIQQTFHAYYGHITDKDIVKNIDNLTVPEKINKPLTVREVQEILSDLSGQEYAPLTSAELEKRYGFSAEIMEALVEHAGVFDSGKAQQEAVHFQKAYSDLTEPQKYLFQALYCSAETVARAVALPVGGAVSGIAGGFSLGKTGGFFVGGGMGGAAGMFVGGHVGATAGGAVGASVGGVVGGPLGAAAAGSVGVVAGGFTGGTVGASIGSCGGSILGGALGITIGSILGGVIGIPASILYSVYNGSEKFLGSYAPEVAAAKVKKALHELSQTEESARETMTALQALQQSDEEALEALHQFFETVIYVTHPKEELLLGDSIGSSKKLTTVGQIEQILSEQIKARMKERDTLITTLQRACEVRAKEKREAARIREARLHLPRGL